MSRISRAVAVGYPHHITQRGNYRQTVFAGTADYEHYLELLERYARRHGLDIWAYCLMPNHVHIVGVPSAEDSMASVFRTVHMLYAQYFNRKSNVAGHLWQGGFTPAPWTSPMPTPLCATWRPIRCARASPRRRRPIPGRAPGATLRARAIPSCPAPAFSSRRFRTGGNFSASVGWSRPGTCDFVNQDGQAMRGRELCPPTGEGPRPSLR